MKSLIKLQEEIDLYLKEPSVPTSLRIINYLHQALPEVNPKFRPIIEDAVVNILNPSSHPVTPFPTQEVPRTYRKLTPKIKSRLEEVKKGLESLNGLATSVTLFEKCPQLFTSSEEASQLMSFFSRGEWRYRNEPGHIVKVSKNPEDYSKHNLYLLTGSSADSPNLYVKVANYEVGEAVTTLVTQNPNVKFTIADVVRETGLPEPYVRNYFQGKKKYFSQRRGSCPDGVLKGNNQVLVYETENP